MGIMENIIYYLDLKYVLEWDRIFIVLNEVVRGFYGLYDF